ncbi:MAG TPA: acyl-CoA thioesterase [Clostridiales bacterium]|nr:acyl-CoA thioesterase [Clostridiales bacterium]
MEVKTQKDSYTVMTELVLSSHVNGSGRLFGGQLMSWMDIAGAICAKRHANCEVVTASAHQLEFFNPALPNDIIIITAEIYNVGRTSMKVHVNVSVEEYGKDRNKTIKTCSAVFVYVAIDKDGIKHQVPKLRLEDGTVLGKSE